jgi:hypothetical protein
MSSRKVKKTTARKAKKPAAKKTVAKKVKKEAEEVVEESAAEDQTTVDGGEDETTDTEDAAEKKIEKRIDEQIQELKDYKAMVRSMCNAFIDNLQDAKREIRQLRRNQKKPRQKDTKQPKKKSTFEIPIVLSNDLCDFLGKPHGTKMCRNAVTHNIQKYCSAKGLMEGRVIKPDRKMKKILKGMPRNKDFELTWLNLQSYIKHNYVS